MNERKKIDRLFQERFKDFEAAPNDRIWNAIHNELHEKKKRRAIPLWWKLSGITAGFVLAFLAFNLLTDNFSTVQKVVNAPQEYKDYKDPKNQNKIPQIETPLAKENPSSLVEAEENNSEENTSYSAKNLEIKTYSKNNLINKKNIKTTKNSSVASDSKVSAKESLKIIKINSKEELAENSSNTTEKGTIKNKSLIKKAVLNTDNSALSTNYINKNKILTEKDSVTFLFTTETNPLEEILKKKNEKDPLIAETNMNRWRITTNFAPVYFNSVSNGSPIDAQFEENNKSYQNNLSVGVGLQYAVNKKLAIRTGINKVTMGYGTNDVVFFGALKAPGLSTLDSGIASSNIEVISANNVAGLRAFEDNFQNMEKGVLNQRMGYYEIPLEVSYALVTRKFGIQVIGGLSTLFLSDNSVSVQSANTTMSLGKANNLNDVHYSGNAGIGFNYQFWKSFEAHFEPTFKYQFNTYSRDSGNFKPYFVGLYTGVSFRF